MTVPGLDVTLLRSIQAETNMPGSEVKMKRESVDFYAKVFALALPVALKSDQIVKTVWAFLRLRSGKWIKKIKVG